MGFGETVRSCTLESYIIQEKLCLVWGSIGGAPGWRKFDFFQRNLSRNARFIDTPLQFHARSTHTSFFALLGDLLLHISSTPFRVSRYTFLSPFVPDPNQRLTRIQRLGDNPFWVNPAPRHQLGGVRK